MTTHKFTEKPHVGFPLRFWSEKVFGVPVNATVTNFTKTKVFLEAYFNGVLWRASRPINAEFMYPTGHPNDREPGSTNTFHFQ